MKLRTRQAPQLLGQKILVAFDTWGSSSRYPTGHLLRPLGNIGGKEAEQESLLLEFDIPYRSFGSAILDCLPPEGDSWTVAASKEDEMWKGREDLRGLNVCSIDPPACQDIDDALHARPLENGNVECGVRKSPVHIPFNFF
jgi:exosome complex exonuclease DIS3/RRP44